MSRKMLIAFAPVVLTALGFAGVLYAQRSETRQVNGAMDMRTMQNMMDDCPMMRSATEGPSAVLKQRQTLGLTASQVAALERIEDRARQSRRSGMEEMRRVHQEMERADGERFDEAAVRRAFQRMSGLHADVAVAMLRARDETRAILTPAQRERFAALRAQSAGMHGMHNMMGMMGMMGMRGDTGTMMDMSHCPMMHGMMHNEGEE